MKKEFLKLSVSQDRKLFLIYRGESLEIGDLLFDAIRSYLEYNALTIGDVLNLRCGYKRKILIKLESNKKEDEFLKKKE